MNVILTLVGGINTNLLLNEILGWKNNHKKEAARISQKLNFSLYGLMAEISEGQGIQGQTLYNTP